MITNKIANLLCAGVLFAELVIWSIRRQNRSHGPNRDTRRGRKTGGRVVVAERGKGRGV